MSNEIQKMKPVIILPPNSMSKSDIQELRANGLCVAVAKDPSRVKFVEKNRNGISLH